MVIIFLGDIHLILCVFLSYFMDYGRPLRVTWNFIVLIHEICSVVTVRSRVVKLVLRFNALRSSLSTIAMAANLIWNKNIINVAVAIDFARVALRHNIVLPIVDDEFEWLTYAYDQLSLKTLQIRIVLARNINLPRLLRRELSKNLNFWIWRQRLLIHIFKEPMLQVDCGFKKANATKEF